MTPHERALLAIYDLMELDRARAALQRSWEAFMLAAMEVELLVLP